jgi:hypothetical protein
MNTRELRIGNWVNCITNIGIKVGKICMLQDIMISADVLDGNNNRKCYGYIGEIQDGEIDFIEPIELTEQMLLGNGFILNKNGLFKGKEGINLLRSGDGWEGVIFNKTSLCDFYRDKIYIHELQNLYYEINKKELDFKL